MPIRVPPLWGTMGGRGSILNKGTPRPFARRRARQCLCIIAYESV